MFVLNKKEFVKALDTLSMVKTSKLFPVIYDNVHFKIESGYAQLTATKLDVSIRYFIEAPGEDCEGVFPVTTTKKLVKSCDGDEITVEFNDGKMKLCGGEIDCGFDPQDFPVISIGNKDDYDIASAPHMLNDIAEVAYAASRDDSRWGLNCLALKKDKNRIVASDGHRLAQLKHLTWVTHDALLPIDTVELLTALAGKKPFMKSIQDSSLTIFWEEKQISFDFGAFVIYSRLSDSGYPDVDRLVELEPPYEEGLRLTVNRAELEKASKVITTFLDKKRGRYAVPFEPNGKKLELVHDDKNGVITKREVKADIITSERPGLFINGNYLYEMASSIRSEEVFIVSGKDTKEDPAAILFFPDYRGAAGNTLHLIMPMSVSKKEGS